MKSFSCSLPTPAENLALDEALLESAQNGEMGPILRFWESPTYFVALGYTNRAATEANFAECAARQIPILRRVSGGGTVLQGAGCLNYALIHPIEAGKEMDVEGTNCLVMRKQKAALETATGHKIEIAGYTDLAMDGFKFSGNAQRRKSRFFLFHGTFLVDFDLELLAKCLKMPSRQPDYRGGRSHSSFVANLGIERAKIKKSLGEIWEAETGEMEIPRARIEQLIAEKYGRREWNEKF